MIYNYKAAITGDELTRYGRGLDELDNTVSVDDLIRRAELISDIIHRLIIDQSNILSLLSRGMKV